MSEPLLPLLIEADELQARFGEPGLFIVDMGDPKTYARGHIPGAVHLDYAAIVHGQRPAPGLLPDPERLSAALGGIGMTPEVHVVAYDDEGGGRACRLLWTLDVLGHTGLSLLNGGLYAWANEGHPLAAEPGHPSSADYPVGGVVRGLADMAYVVDHLDDPHVALLDTRSPAEFSGAKRLAARGGHIPGAVNLNWTDTMDEKHNLRLKPAGELRAMLHERGITPDKEIIVYCQTHHRSAHTYVMLRTLGYPEVRGYAGSWSEWGNSPDTPVET